MTKSEQRSLVKACNRVYIPETIVKKATSREARLGYLIALIDIALIIVLS